MDLKPHQHGKPPTLGSIPGVDSWGSPAVTQKGTWVRNTCFHSYEYDSTVQCVIYSDQTQPDNFTDHQVDLY